MTAPRRAILAALLDDCATVLLARRASLHAASLAQHLELVARRYPSVVPAYGSRAELLDLAADAVARAVRYGRASGAQNGPSTASEPEDAQSGSPDAADAHGGDSGPLTP